MKAALEMSSQSEFGLVKLYQLKAHKNFKPTILIFILITSDIVNYFPFKLYSIVSSDSPALLHS